MVNVLLEEFRIFLHDDLLLHVLFESGLRDHVVVRLRDIDFDNRVAALGRDYLMSEGLS